MLPIGKYRLENAWWARTLGVRVAVVNLDGHCEVGWMRVAWKLPAPKCGGGGTRTHLLDSYRDYLLAPLCLEKL